MVLQEVFSQAEEINIYKNSEMSCYAAGDEKFNEIIAQWNGMLEGSHQMPAFGVSINDYTTKAIEKGTWIEFVFSGCKCVDDMPFEKLLVEVKSEYCGFNVNRYNSQGGYSGRCFYIALENDMSRFYDYLTKCL